MKYIILCIVIICMPNVIFSISIKEIIKAEYDPEEFSVLEPHTIHRNAEGIFERFMRSLLDLLSTNFPERKLTRYCRILNRALKELNYRATRDLAKHLRYLSRMYRDDVKDELVKYRNAYDKKSPYKTEFLQAMNRLFTLRENLLFTDYLHDLRDFGNEDKLDIHAETRKIINDVIINSINKLRVRDQYELEKKLKRAIKEHIKLSDY